MQAEIESLMKRLASQEAKLARLESILEQEGGGRAQDAERQEESDSLSRSARALNQLTKR